MPDGRDGNIPEGLFTPLILSSQKHFGQSKNNAMLDGDKDIGLTIKLI